MWWDKPQYDLTGQRFGRLTVINCASTSGRRRWTCICDCGHITNAAANNLKSGNIVSCGCALQGCNKKEPFLWLYNKLLGDKRSFAKDLTFDDFLEFTKVQNCHYCDKPVLWKPHAKNNVNGAAYNLDRKNNSLGYTKSNCVVCCTRCNRVKGSEFSYEEFLDLGVTIRKIDAKRIS